ncbi:MAG: hypothetical protein ACTSXC_08565 [Candidatus Freyarchaeota archaeon]
MASILLKPWVYFYLNREPPFPLPRELEMFPLALNAFGRIMVKTRNDAFARVYAIELMLANSGFSQEQAEEIVRRIT